MKCINFLLSEKINKFYKIILKNGCLYKSIVFKYLLINAIECKINYIHITMIVLLGYINQFFLYRRVHSLNVK